MADTACHIGNGIQVRGNLSGSGDLVVEGRVEGHVILQAHVTVAESGTVVAEVDAEEMTILGKMTGNTRATKRVSLTTGAVCEGDLTAPRIVLEDGARFRGRIAMDVPLPDDI